MSRCSAESLRGGNLEQNADVIRRILSSTATREQSEVALLNAAAVIYVAGRAPDIRAGLELARESVRSGNAQSKLDELVEFTNR